MAVDIIIGVMFVSFTMTCWVYILAEGIVPVVNFMRRTRKTRKWKKQKKVFNDWFLKNVPKASKEEETAKREAMSRLIREVRDIGREKTNGDDNL